MVDFYIYIKIYPYVYYVESPNFMLKANTTICNLYLL